MWARLGSTDLMAGKVMFLRSNQGGRLDGNESVADSFRSDLVGFKSWSARILGAFYSFFVCQKNPQLPGSSPATRVNGDWYRTIITNFLIPELNNHDVQELWFQQDSSTCHTARTTIDLLKDTFGDRLISRFGPVNWPPRSCDLTPLDYFLWGYVKSLVYADKPQTPDHLEATFAMLLPIYGHRCWKKLSKIGRPDWTTSEPAVAVICQKSYLKFNATRVSFE
ncbi:uncharacterized protein TNCV_3887201 [Trichonephila clavipes]|nr:uncharacterized protein TNCV_3887201 [Trichonephila clavipes]